MEDALDQVLFVVDEQTFEQVTALLDSTAVPNEDLERLLAVQAPWRTAPEQR